MARVYATVTELSAFTGRPAPDNAERLLARASRLVDAAMKAAVYEVDASGAPVVPEVRDAFRDATCAQADVWAGREASEAEIGPWNTVSAGSVSMSRFTTPPSVADDTALTPEAAEILAGLGLPTAVWS